MKKQNFVSNISKSIVLALVLTFIFTTLALANEPDTPTRLVIPVIDLDSQIVSVGWREIIVEGKAGYQQLVDNNLVGWHEQTAKLGQVGNTVLNGHSNIYAQVFRDLEKVEIGDEIIAFSGDQEYRYIITQLVVVREKGVSVEERIANALLITPTDDERLTLITCTQPGATHRLIVIAQPVAQ